MRSLTSGSFPRNAATGTVCAESKRMNEWVGAFIDDKFHAVTARARADTSTTGSPSAFIN